MKSQKRIIVTPGEIIDKKIRTKTISKYVTSGKGSIMTSLGVIQEGKKSIDILVYKDIYKPSKNDYVIGVVVGYAPNGWIIDIGSYTKAFLPAIEIVKGEFDPRNVDLSKYLAIGDIVGLKISEVRRLGYFLGTIRHEAIEKDKKYGKIKDYYLLKIHSSRLPRVIGKKGSMIKLIKQALKCEIIIAQNGVILFKGSIEKFNIFRRVINIIVEKTYASGLTNYIIDQLKNMVKESKSIGVNQK